MTPAVSAAALEPKPLPMGISLLMVSWTGGKARCARAATVSAVFQIRLSSLAGIRWQSRPLTRIDSRLLTEKRHSRYTFSAIPENRSLDRDWR